MSGLRFLDVFTLLRSDGALSTAPQLGWLWMRRPTSSIMLCCSVGVHLRAPHTSLQYAPHLCSAPVSHTPLGGSARGRTYSPGQVSYAALGYPGLVGSHDAQWPRDTAPLRCVTVVDGACPASAPVAPLPRDIRINVLSPGTVDTESLRSALAMAQDPDAIATPVQKMGEGDPTGRIAEPREMGTAAVFLSSDALSVVTGIEHRTLRRRRMAQI